MIEEVLRGFLCALNIWRQVRAAVSLPSLSLSLFPLLHTLGRQQVDADWGL